jgi:hypothetical protein
VEGVVQEANVGIQTLDLEIRKAVIRKLKGSWFESQRSSIGRRITKAKMQEVCLMLADQQLVTGASILLVGYTKQCTMTQYHFYIAANLSLVSFATYQSVLLIVRDMLEENIRKGWRLAWIMAVFGCVLILNFILYNDNYLVPRQQEESMPRNFGLPMECIWEKLPGSFTQARLVYVIFGLLVDISSAYSITLILFPDLRKVKLFSYIEEAVGQLASQPTSLYRIVKDHNDRWHWFLKAGWMWTLLEWPTWALFVFTFTLREIFTSLYWDMVRIFLYLFSSTWSIKRARGSAVAQGRVGSQEDSWGFGQILPLLLLALPLFSLIESIFGKQTSPPILRYCLIYRGKCLESTDMPPGSSRQSSANSRRSKERKTPLKKFEEDLYAEKWFLAWAAGVWFMLLGTIVALTVLLEYGVPR